MHRMHLNTARAGISGCSEQSGGRKAFLRSALSLKLTLPPRQMKSGLRTGVSVWCFAGLFPLLLGVQESPRVPNSRMLLRLPDRTWRCWGGIYG
ncbi:hypothetical protein N657DRAFT_481901 [Parathielavia appendiculata]|uniref:Uncharacterized protein n=1 Tax=Parathielavia appendiculata TaxID=2587402 RepID=A0AAN6Z2F1_9PEZI|nr:hypothetical protein N657DRAFT_481901 [Parathielavia appendiculata]